MKLSIPSDFGSGLREIESTRFEAKRPWQNPFSHGYRAIKHNKGLTPRISHASGLKAWRIAKQKASTTTMAISDRKRNYQQQIRPSLINDDNKVLLRKPWSKDRYLQGSTYRGGSRHHVAGNADAEDIAERDQTDKVNDAITFSKVWVALLMLYSLCCALDWLV